MADTTFTDYVTPVPATWLNEVNDHVHSSTPVSPATTVHPASVIANTPSGTIAATTVQAAIDELNAEKAALAGSASQAFSALTLTSAGKVSGATVSGTYPNGAVVGLASDTGTGVTGGSSSGYGVYGKSADSVGVYGTCDVSTAIVGITLGAGAGVAGTSASGHGVTGTASGAGGGVGVYGTGNGGNGVQGASTNGIGGSFTSAANYALFAQGDTTSPVKAAFRLVPQDAEPTGASSVGDMYVTTAGVLKICTVAGTPGTYVSVGSQV